MKVLYLFPSPRKKLLEGYKEGIQPDTLLMGLNHLWKYSIQADFLDPGTNILEKFLMGTFENLSGINIYQPIKSLLILHNYDLVVSKDIKCGYLLTLLKKVIKWKKPIIFIDSIAHENIKFARFLGYGLSAANRISYNTTSLEAIFSIKLGIPKEKLQYIPWGVDQHFFNPLEVEKESFILSVGNAGRDYNTLIAAIKDVSIGLRIATSRIQKSIEASTKVEISKLSPLELRDAYTKSKLVVIPIHNIISSSGITSLLEGMAMGKAVIISDSIGIRDYVDNWKNAILVKPENTKELRDAILYLKENPIEVEKIGKNARKTVERKFNTEIEAKNLAALFRETHENR